MPANLGPWFGSAIGMLISPFSTLISINVTYCFTARTNVRNHQTETETLKGTLLRIEQDIIDGRRNGLIPTDEADLWVQRATQAISEEEANCKSFVNRCRIFGCSLNLWGKYKTSKEAAEKVDVVKIYRKTTPLANNVTREPPPPPVVYLPTHSVQLLPSREDTLQHALRCIKDDLTVGLIGIWVPDRDEKTHLLKKTNNSFLGGCPFDFVIFVTASSECSVQNIQAQITKRLCINQHDDVATQATRIFELLRTKSFLLLVDDLRVQLDLQVVGIPYPLGNVEVVEGVQDLAVVEAAVVAQDQEIVEVVEAVQYSRQVQRKVVVTSTSQSICHMMDVEMHIQMPHLGEDEARQLFTNYAHDPYSDPGIGALEEVLVIELKSLPSDLIRYGKLMQGKKDPRQWEDAIDAIRKAKLQSDEPLNLAEKIIRNVENMIEDLHAKRDDVRLEIANADRQQRTATNEVNRWLKKVDTIIRDVEVISWDCRQLKKDVTMEASEKLREVYECVSSCPSNIVVESMPPPVQEMPGPSMSAQNRNLRNALRYIKDDPTVGMIGIWGPGGVGKTHLLKNINNSFGESTTFNFVLFVTASRGCSVEKFQSQIMEMLELKSTGYKTRTIYEYMKTKSFLVLLDDLWDPINLEDVGIPYPLGNVNNLKRKVVLTTRLRKVCGQMKVEKELNVPYLQEHEAWQLFEENVGTGTLSSPHIEALARELMKELKGLPLALTTIAKAMYRKDAAQWETAIQYMQQSCCTDDKDPIELGMETGVFMQLKFSYDNLRSDTLRECFKTCALWPEDASISKVDLANCWMGLGLVNEHDIESSFRKSYNLIADLTAVCLLEDIEDSHAFVKVHGFVKVHDVIRDMAVWISCDCGENNDKWIVRPPAGKDKKVIIPWNKAEYISLMSNRLTQLVPTGFHPDPIKLRILCLQGNKLNERVIAEAIKNCTSLTYLDLSSNDLMSIPEELCSFGKLEYLNLSDNDLQVTELPRSIGKLINLKFLYLRNTSIRTIPSEVMSSLKALQVIDLRTISELYGTTVREPYLKGRVYFNHGVLFREFGTLPELKAIGTIAIGFDEFDSLRVAANLPLRYLTLIKLDKLTDILLNEFARRSLYDLVITSCDNLEQISVRHDTGQPNRHFGSLNQLSLLIMPELKEIAWMGATPASTLPRLTCLELCACESLLHLSWVMYLPRLEELFILQCDSMVQAFMRCLGDKFCNGQEKKKTFPSLKFLYLQGNHSLDSIGDNGMEFPSLERLVLMQCPMVKRLPFQLNSMPPKLKELGFYDVQEWERLEWEDGVKTLLQPALNFGAYRL